MPVVFTATTARFEDVCTVEEGLPLCEFLKSGEALQVDLAACSFLHTALLQLLLAARPILASPPTDPYLARWVGPLLAGEQENS
jgi:hypothetical protein